MSPVGDLLRVRCRQFPSLVNTCTLDWFSRWPEEALLYVSTAFLKDLHLPSEEVREGLAKMCMKIHTSVEESADKFFSELRRRVYTTPKSYLDLINLYLISLEQKRNEFDTNKNRLANGLKKLNDTNDKIAVLKVALADMQPKLVQKNEELKVALERVNQDKKVADEKEAVVSAEAEIVNEKAAKAQDIVNDVEADLMEAKPELDAAKESLGKLEKPLIVELRSFNNPHDSIVIVMEALMVLFGEKKDWNSARQFMADVNAFLNKLKTFDVGSVPEKLLNKVRKDYLSQKSFNIEEVGKKSMAAMSIAMWLKACSNYANVLKKVQPKQDKYKEVKAELDGAQAELKIKTDQLDEVKAAVKKLEDDCKRMQDEKEVLEREMDKSAKRMARAEKLVVLLKDEGIRWGETVEVMKVQIEELVGDVFLSAACISYFGAFTGKYREKLVDFWVKECKGMEIPTGDKFSL